MNAPPTTWDILRKVADAAFGRPLVTNVLRGMVAEAIVACALEPEWHWCAQDYANWDFERADGLRLKVKQSAARQSWATSDKPSACSFDIAARKGRLEGATWIDAPGRAAQIYVFAHHPVADISADQRDPAQWNFHVVRSANLPATRSLSLARARQLCPAVDFAMLKAAVSAAADL